MTQIMPAYCFRTEIGQAAHESGKKRPPRPGFRTDSRQCYGTATPAHTLGMGGGPTIPVTLLPREKYDPEGDLEKRTVLRADLRPLKLVSTTCRPPTILKSTVFDSGNYCLCRQQPGARVSESARKPTVALLNRTEQMREEMSLYSELVHHASLQPMARRPRLNGWRPGKPLKLV